MKINTLLEYTSPSSQPNQSGGQAPEFGRDPNVLETTTGSGSVATVNNPVGGMQRRNSKGSMFQGIKTSKKFVNSPVTEDEISEEQLLARQIRKELFNKAKDHDIGNRPKDYGIMAKESDPEYDDEAGMTTTNLHTALRAVEGLNKVIGPNENLPEWVQEKIAIANDYLVTCWDYMISQHEQGRKYEVDENQDWMKDIAAMAHKMAPQDKMRQRQAERQAQEKIEQQQRIQKDVENLPNLISQYNDMEAEYESMGGSNWQYADREQNLSDEERKARGMETSLRQLANRIRAAKKASEGLAEVAPPGAKAERMVKHIKKSYSKDGKLTPKEKSIAYATAWKAHNKGSMEEQGVAEEQLDEACWKGYHKEGMKTMFGKRYPNCVRNKNESLETYIRKRECPGCGGTMVAEGQLNEKQDACYHKVKSRYKVWPSAYASGALVQCRKKGAANWGNSNESITQEEYDQLDENLKKWFSDKWVRFGPDGKIRGDCARGDDSEGKPKCLPQSKAHSLGKKGRASAASRKRREDPNPERSGKAINVNTKKKSNEGI